VGRNLQGPLDSTSTDRRGRFRFAFRSDTTVLYLLSGRHAGIEYFSPPVHTNPERPDTALRIIVYDTSSSVPIALEARHLVITQPGEDGSRSVLDLLVLRNDGRLTRVAPDSSRPAWSGPLPHGTLGLELGEGDLSPDAISRRNDSLIVTAPLAPGEKQLTVQYLVPSDREVIELPFPDSLSTVNVLVEEKGVRVSGGTMAAADSQMIRGRSFRRWTGTIPAGGALRITVPSTRRTPRWMLAGLVVGVVLALSGAGWYFLSRRGFEVSAGSADELLERLAALDARYLGQEAGTGPAEWSAYQAQRAHLKEQLEASLAAGRRSR
jgi:hypothetical protein